LDRIAYLEYQPTPAIASLVVRSGMNDNGKFLFYASQPKLDGTQSFNQECNKVESTVSILGCYNGSKIFIYDIQDAELDGVREVTAAHETLHVAYQRMSDTDKKRVGKLLEIEYGKLASDKRFTDLIAYYAKAEPDQRSNELHSIIGTEVRDISPELESHYKKFFSSRLRVVDLSEKYTAVFQSLKAKADTMSKQLNELSALISSQTDEYNQGAQTLSNDIDSFNIKASSQGFTSYNQFYTERNRLTARVSALESLRSTINDEIKQYQELLKQYDALALQSKQLYDAIDSSLAPTPSLQ